MVHQVFTLWALVLGLCLGAAQALRTRCDTRVMMYYSVGSNEGAQNNVKKGIARVKSALGNACVDVFLAHYEGIDGWKDKDWYAREVTHHFNQTGNKFKLLRDFHRTGGTHNWWIRYDYIWALDSDVGLDQTDINKFFRVAKNTSAMIVGPTFFPPAPNFISTADHADKSSSQCCQKVAPKCSYRDTDFVEMVAPMFKPEAIRLVLEQCNCIEEDSDWGSDLVWCKFVAERTHEKGCAVIDAAPVMEIKGLDGRGDGSPIDWRAKERVMARMPQYLKEANLYTCRK